MAVGQLCDYLTVSLDVGCTCGKIHVWKSNIELVVIATVASWRHRDGNKVSGDDAVLRAPQGSTGLSLEISVDA